MKPKGQARETSFAKEAFQRYLQLPRPRKLEDLVGLVLENTGGKSSVTLKESTIRTWAYKHSWSQRASDWDDQVMAQERQAIIDWRLEEARRREQARLQAADLQRQMAVRYLTEPGSDEPRPMQECDPLFLNLADKYIKTAAEIEYRDLLPTVKQAESESQERGIGPIVVLGADGLDQLRGLVPKLQAAQPKPAALLQNEMVDADFEVS